MSASKKKDSARAKGLELAFLEGVRKRCPGRVRILKPLAELYTELGRYQEGLGVDQELAERCPSESGVWYNLGCSYALTAQPDRAFQALERAVELGYSDGAWMREDQDLTALRDDPRFEEVLRRVTS